MVIDELIVIEDEEQKLVDSADNKTIDVINYDSVNYHFAKENEVTNSICEESVKEPLINMNLIGNTFQGNLPTEYQQVEYIESTGTQYIDTGIMPNQNTGFDIEFFTKNKFNSTVGEFGSIFGAREGSSVNELQLSSYSRENDKGLIRFGTIGRSAGLVENTKMQCSLRNKIYTNNDDVTIEFTSDFTTLYPITVFALNNKGNITQHGSVQIFFLKLYNLDTLIRDFVPCYRKSDSVIGLYDLVEQKFYTNQGTGDFRKGAEIISSETPIEIESFGEKTPNLFNVFNAVQQSNYVDRVKLNEDGSLTIYQPTGSSVSDYTTLQQFAPSLEVGKTYVLNFETTGTISATNNIWLLGTNQVWKRGTSRTITESDLNSTVWWYGDGEGQTITISQIQITEGTDTKEYEPYGYKVPIKVEEIEYISPNILPFIYGNKSTTANGGTLTVNSDSSITASGTPTGYVGVSVYSGKLLKGSTNKITISLYGNAVNTNVIANLLDADGNNITQYVARINEPITVDYNSYPTATKVDIAYRRNSNGVKMSGTAYIMINEGTEAFPYTPYGETVPLKIMHSIYDFDSEKIKTVPYTSESTRSGFDLGVLSAGNYIFDWELFDDNIFPYYIYLRHQFEDGTMAKAEFITTEKDYTPLKFTADGTSHYYMSFADSNIYLEKAKREWNEKIKHAYLQKGTEIKNPTINIYLNEPLRKIGDYVDYIDYKNKKVVRSIARDYIENVEFLSTNSGTYKIFLSNISYKPLINYGSYNSSAYSSGYAISNKFMQSSYRYNQVSGYPNRIQPYITSGNINRVAYTFDDSSITTLEQAQEVIGNGFEVCYVLATPTEETINIPTIETFDGTTIFEIENKIKPSQIKINYWKQI